MYVSSCLPAGALATVGLSSGHLSHEQVFSQHGEVLSHEPSDRLVRVAQHGRKVPLIGNPLLHLSLAAHRAYVPV